MNRRQVLVLGGGVLVGQQVLLAGAAHGQFFGGNTFSQRLDATCASGEALVGQFLPARGARRISATVRCDVLATAFLDVTDNQLDENDAVLGAAEVELPPRQSRILVLPGALLAVVAVRLRVVNRDRTFGRVVGTLTVAP